MSRFHLVLSGDRNMDEVPFFPSGLTRMAPDRVGKPGVLERHQLRNVQRRYIADPEPRVAQSPSEDERLESVLRAHSFAGMALAIGHEFPSFVDIKQVLVGEGLLRLHLRISNDFMLLRGPVIQQPFAAFAIGEEAAQVRREARSS